MPRNFVSNINNHACRKYIEGRPLAVLHATDQQSIPQGVHLRSASIHHLGKVLVYLCRPERVSILCAELVDHELIEHGLDVLEIGHVAAGADDGVGAHRIETLDIFEPRERSV